MLFYFVVLLLRFAILVVLVLVLFGFGFGCGCLCIWFSVVWLFGGWVGFGDYVILLVLGVNCEWLLYLLFMFIELRILDSGGWFVVM